MSKKDYVLIASALNKHYKNNTGINYNSEFNAFNFNDTIFVLWNAFKSENKAFDFELFKTACLA